MADIIQLPKTNDEKLADWIDVVGKTLERVATALEVLEKRIEALEKQDE